MFVGLNSFFQNLHPIEWGGEFGADGGMTSHVLFADVFGRPCGVGGLHNLEIRMVVQEVAALHQSHWVGVHFRDVVPVFVGQTHEAVTDSQFVLSDNLCAAVTQQLIVVEQAAGNRILYGHQSQRVGVVIHTFKHLFKGVATHNVEFLTCEILVGCDVVETPNHSLDGNLFDHLFLF